MCQLSATSGPGPGQFVSVEVHGGKTLSKRGTAPLKPKSGLSGPPDGAHLTELILRSLFATQEPALSLSKGPLQPTGSIGTAGRNPTFETLAHTIGPCGVALQVATLCVGVGHGRYSSTQGHAEKLAAPG
jgi:hypothetical protein